MSGFHPRRTGALTLRGGETHMPSQGPPPHSTTQWGHTCRLSLPLPLPSTLSTGKLTSGLSDQDAMPLVPYPNPSSGFHTAVSRGLVPKPSPLGTPETHQRARPAPPEGNLAIRSSTKILRGGETGLPPQGHPHLWRLHGHSEPDILPDLHPQHSAPGNSPQRRPFGPAMPRPSPYP